MRNALLPVVYYAFFCYHNTSFNRIKSKKSASQWNNPRVSYCNGLSHRIVLLYYCWFDFNGRDCLTCRLTIIENDNSFPVRDLLWNNLCPSAIDINPSLKNVWKPANGHWQFGTWYKYSYSTLICTYTIWIFIVNFWNKLFFNWKLGSFIKSYSVKFSRKGHISSVVIPFFVSRILKKYFNTRKQNVWTSLNCLYSPKSGNSIPYFPTPA